MVQTCRYIAFKGYSIEARHHLITNTYLAKENPEFIAMMSHRRSW